MAITKINTPELFDLGATNTALRLPSGSTASRPSNPSTGEWRYNTDDNKVEYWDGSAWFQIDDEAAATTIVPEENFSPNTYIGNGSTNLLTSKIGNAAYFNGSSSYIELSDSVSASTGNNDFSLSAWVYLNSMPSNFACVMTTQANWYFYIFITSDGKVQTYNGSVVVESSTGVITSGQWYHIAATVSSTNGKNVYVNGTNVATSSNTSNCSAVSASNMLGVYDGGSINQYYLNGKIDQVRIFNTALNLTQVGQLYLENSYSATTKSTTDFFGNGTGVALYELDGNSYSSNFEKAAVFNGSSSKIDTNTAFTSLVGNSTSYSISTWIYPTSNTTGRPFGTENFYDGFILQTSNGNVKAGGGNGSAGSFVTTSDYACAINQWHHICLVITTNSSIKLYVDNVLKETLSLTISFSGSARLFLGGDYNSTVVESPFTGKIDQVRIFNTALSGADVTKLYNESSQIPTTNLVAWYKLDGNAVDSYGTYDGTPSNVTYSGGVYSGTDNVVGYQGTAFQPDLVWIKNRVTAVSHCLFDSIRGAGTANQLYSDSASAQGADTNLTNFVSFDTNGFTLGATSGFNVPNYNGDNYVAWCWKAGGVPTPNNNTQGTITSTVSANQAAGFSIVKYNYTQSASSFTIGHGLSSAPELIILKAYATTSSWFVYSPAGTEKELYLNSTGIAATDYNRWANTAPTNTVFTIGTSFNYPDYAGNTIAYCFHSVDGYQKVGSYIGSNSNLQVTTGFQPRFVLLKNKDAATPWVMFDSLRSGNLYANDSAAESDTASNYISFNSTGFELVGGTGSYINIAGYTWIYLAIA